MTKVTFEEIYTFVCIYGPTGICCGFIKGYRPITGILVSLLLFSDMGMILKLLFKAGKKAWTSDFQCCNYLVCPP